MTYTLGCLTAAAFRMGPALLPLGPRLVAALSGAFATPSQVSGRLAGVFQTTGLCHTHQF